MDCLSTIEVAEAVGVTPRQLDYWVRRGYIPGLSSKGTGSGRCWGPDHVDRARTVAATFAQVVALLRAADLPTGQFEGRTKHGRYTTDEKRDRMVKP